MDGMNTAHINGKIIAWARKRANVSIESLASGNVSPEKVTAWERGDELPSENQAETLAAKLGIAYAMLFMADPPMEDGIDIPDLRTVSGKSLVRPSLDFLEVLEDAANRQEWYRSERLEESSKPLEFVGRFTIEDDPKTVAAHMRVALSLSTALRNDCKDYEEFLKKFVANAEKIGILIMRSAVVRHITARPLKVEEFRGFALVDPVAPVVFMNDADAKAAQVFTLAHELAHVWIGEGGVSDRQPDEKKSSRNAIELFCDQVAAELLVPTEEFEQYWSAGRNVEQNARVSAQHFRVSSLVVLRRAKDLKKISSAEFFSTVDEHYERFKRKDREKREKQKKSEKKGGNFWASFELRNGARFNASVIESLKAQKTSYTEAAGLFGISLGATVGYLKRIGIFK
jgi:Zn-dependent peptidase ImmA (M78 family)